MVCFSLRNRLIFTTTVAKIVTKIVAKIVDKIVAKIYGLFFAQKEVDFE